MGGLFDPERNEIWDRWEAGGSQRSIPRSVGKSPSVARGVLVRIGSVGRCPKPGACVEVVAR